MRFFTFAVVTAGLLTISSQAFAKRSCRFDDIAEHIRQQEAHPTTDDFYDLLHYATNRHTGRVTRNGLRLGYCVEALLFPKYEVIYPGQSRMAWKNNFEYAWTQGYDNDAFQSDGMRMMGGCQTHACFPNRAEIFFSHDGMVVAAMSTIGAYDLLPGETRPPGHDPQMYRSILGIRKGYDTPAVREFITKALAHENGYSYFFQLQPGDQHRLSVTEIPQP